MENPADTRWLLNPRDAMLPRIFTAIKPHVLPKLREENERALEKKKKKPVKDVIDEGMTVNCVSRSPAYERLATCQLHR